MRHPPPARLPPPRPRTRLRVEDLPVIDVWALARVSTLDAPEPPMRLDGVVHRLNMTDEAVELRDYSGRLLLDRVALAYVPTTFGGARAFLVCPTCRHRRVRLYWHAHSISCRACLRAVYTSQSVNDGPNLQAQYARLTQLLARPCGRRRLRIAARLARVEAALDQHLLNEMLAWDRDVQRIRQADALAASPSTPQMRPVGPGRPAARDRLAAGGVAASWADLSLRRPVSDRWSYCQTSGK